WSLMNRNSQKKTESDFQKQFSKAIFEREAYYSHIVGFIDGIMQHICRPTGNTAQKNMYNDWKHIHCNKLQATSTTDGITTSLCGPYVKRRNYRGMLIESQISERLSAHFN
ncbi:hypothetical protein BD408DRAFT_316204, partial [Parasitella parasitica]